MFYDYLISQTVVVQLDFINSRRRFAFCASAFALLIASVSPLTLIEDIRLSIRPIDCSVLPTIIVV
jgi:hypothetical protein